MKTQNYSPKFVIQPKKTRICGHCCVAMITGLPLEMIVDFIGHKNGTHIRELAECLLWFGYDCSYMKIRSSALEGLCLVHVKGPHTGGGGHWVVFFEGMIWDSCSTVFSYTEENMKLYQWKVKGYYKIRI